jgi:prevent-host-death family protein
MAMYNMHEAKAQLSRLAERAASGEEIVIARAGLPLAKLAPIEHRQKTRMLGLWAGQIWVSDDFDDPLPWEVQKYFQGCGG